MRELAWPRCGTLELETRSSLLFVIERLLPELAILLDSSHYEVVHVDMSVLAPTDEDIITLTQLAIILLAEFELGLACTIADNCTAAAKLGPWSLTAS